MRASTFLMAVALLNSASAWAQVTIRPGQYEFTIDMKMAVPKEAQKAVLDAAGSNREMPIYDTLDRLGIALPPATAPVAIDLMSTFQAATGDLNSVNRIVTQIPFGACVEIELVAEIRRAQKRPAQPAC